MACTPLAGFTAYLARYRAFFGAVVVAFAAVHRIRLGVHARPATTLLGEVGTAVCAVEFGAAETGSVVAIVGRTVVSVVAVGVAGALDAFAVDAILVESAVVAGGAFDALGAVAFLANSAVVVVIAATAGVTGLAAGAVVVVVDTDTAVAALAARTISAVFGSAGV